MKFWPQEFQMREGCLSCANGSNLLVPLWLCVSVYLKLGSHKHVTRISVVGFDQKLEVLFVVTNFYQKQNSLALSQSARCLLLQVE